MKKKYYAYLMSVIMMACVTGCQNQDVDSEVSASADVVAQEVESTVSTVEESQETIETESTSLTEETISESESETEETTEEMTTTEQENENTGEIDINSLNADQQKMYYVMDSLADCCYYEEYNPADPEFFWRAIYYFVTDGSYKVGGVTDKESENFGTVSYAERSTVEKYAAGLFENYNGLLDVPEDSYSVRIDGDGNYEFMQGDRGLEYTKIASWDIEANSTEKVVINSIYDHADEDVPYEEVVASYEITLVENPQLKNDSDQIFKYSVRDVKKIK